MPSNRSQYSLSDLSARFELELRGDGEHRIDGVATLSDARSGQISFLANPGYRKQLGTTRAGAVILKESDAADCPTNCLVAPEPYLAYARLATLFDPRPSAPPGIHASAVIAPSARLGKDVSIGAHVVIGDDCDIGDGCTIGPGCVLDSGGTLGAGCRLYANVSLGYGVKIGKRVIIHPGAVIGADGFGIAFAGDHWEKVPQVGTVVIGDDCEIGANSCIDRGALGDTILEEDCRLDNLVQIGHNVVVGAHTAIAAMGGAAGSAKIGKFCLLGGQAAVNGHQEIADRTTLAATSKVMKPITEPGTTWSGLIPAQPIKEWQRSVARLRRLDELQRRVQNLEKQLGNDTEDD
ncbi:UDP-3-O-(3-hydroxymyristoyl)glucosamine N-acyltransferase [Pseudomonadota bacterium]|jgi:UDP-3-O-[3-hydroxymyristoyl] glucosamine N-acyltransferase|nr:UDP-3-O-(3-hydroxymyristoyl)glucosamine N-acyltransferase [Xanthomonadales bacterium]